MTELRDQPAHSCKASGRTHCLQQRAPMCGCKINPENLVTLFLVIEFQVKKRQPNLQISGTGLVEYWDGSKNVETGITPVCSAWAIIGLLEKQNARA